MMKSAIPSWSIVSPMREVQQSPRRGFAGRMIAGETSKLRLGMLRYRSSHARRAQRIFLANLKVSNFGIGVTHPS